MLKYPKETDGYQSCNKSKIKTEYLILLEKALRLLGDFKEEDPIIINRYEIGEEYFDIIYEVEDKRGTTFKFYNFSLGNISDTRRYSQSYHLIMTRKNSNISYKYDFAEMDYVEFSQGIRMIEISYCMPENRVIKLEREIHRPIRIIVEEENKKYILGFYDNKDEYDITLLKDFENMLEKFINIKDLNLENLIGILNDKSKLSFIYIYKDNKVLASIDFIGNNVHRYEINGPTKKLRVTVGNKTTRTVEREINGEIVKTNTEITEENYEKLQSDYKRLFKQL